ncbi:hypothetical protein [Dendrosporobacter sp. 1207_IL3150]|uniref:hypothetical protein n=1 Tax=Dendrosporobacter sp. 1207_IL3150 TaxID=3084054 RepID=UPI002FD8BBDA
MTHFIAPSIPEVKDQTEGFSHFNENIGAVLHRLNPDDLEAIEQAWMCLAEFSPDYMT